MSVITVVGTSKILNVQQVYIEYSISMSVRAPHRSQSHPEALCFQLVSLINAMSQDHLEEIWHKQKLRFRDELISLGGQISKVKVLTSARFF